MHRLGSIALAVPLALIGPLAAAHAGEVGKVVSEDEDAFVELSLTTNGPGGGTGWANQVISSRNGAPVSNETTGWMTFYGLPKKKSVTFELASGKCGSGKPVMDSSGPYRTDKLGGWHGKYVFRLGASKTWVTRGGYHVQVVTGSKIRACGPLRDDPDIGN